MCIAFLAYAKWRIWRPFLVIVSTSTTSPIINGSAGIMQIIGDYNALNAGRSMSRISSPYNDNDTSQTPHWYYRPSFSSSLLYFHSTHGAVIGQRHMSNCGVAFTAAWRRPHTNAWLPSSRYFNNIVKRHSYFHIVMPVCMASRVVFGVSADDDECVEHCSTILALNEILLIVASFLAIREPAILELALRHVLWFLLPLKGNNP